ncbi:MAG: hypothetical protein ABI967_12280 [bacterium]
MNNWKQAVLPCLLLAIVALIPQFYLCFERGAKWHGGFAYFDADEFGYAAYLQAVIDGKGRHADPYTGKQSKSETLYSIQFFPPYALSLLGWLGLTASSIFLLLVPLVAIISGLLIFALIHEVTGNSKIAAAGVLGVLILAALAAIPIPGLAPSAKRGFGQFPFLRRYLPAFPFMLLLAFTLSLWRGLTKSLWWAVGSGIFFALLVYSYFYLWTAALAWSALFLFLWILFQPDRRRTIKVSGVLAAFAVSVVPWIWLVSNRSKSFDGDQVLRHTRALDLFQTAEVAGAVIVICIAWLRGWKDRRLIFIASLALTPFILFNQQVITGRSLQSFHYAQFVTNYWIIMAIFIALGMWRTMPKRIPNLLLVGSLVIGLMLSVQAANSSYAVSARVDQAQGLKKRLDPGVVFSPNIALMYALPGQNQPLWAQHSYTFANLTLLEQRQRFFQFLYYQKLPVDQLKLALEKDSTSRVEVFGSARANELLSQDHKPITDAEINEAVNEYVEFSKSFTPMVTLSYAVVAPGDDLTNLDLWYERDSGESFEDLTIYRLKLRKPEGFPSSTLVRTGLAEIAQRK